MVCTSKCLDIIVSSIPSIKILFVQKQDFCNISRVKQSEKKQIQFEWLTSWNDNSLLMILIVLVKV